MSSTKKTVEFACPLGVTWGSIDPVAEGASALYPSPETIETALTAGAPSVSLSIFGGLTVVFNNGRSYQQTSGGYRSVFRLDAGEPDAEGGSTRTVQLEVAHFPRLNATPPPSNLQPET